MSVTAPTHATREQVRTALQVPITDTRINNTIDRLTAAATAHLEEVLQRGFFPVTATRVFPAGRSYGRPWQLWFGHHELITLTALTVGGVTIPNTDYYLEPANTGPPFNRVELDRSKPSTFTTAGGAQRAATATGVWGYQLTERAVGTLTGGINATDPALTVSNSAPVGAGSLIRVDTERLLVTDRAMVDTGLTVAAPGIGDTIDHTTITASGAGVQIGETIAVDQERMLVIDAVGAQLVVRRAWEGTQLVSHATGAVISAPRRLSVARAAAGTTPATHSGGAAVVVHAVPDLVVKAGLAHSLYALGQEAAGYARPVGTEDAGRALGPAAAVEAVISEAYAAHGRRVRTRIRA